jgi:hypothetical protein
LFRIANEYLAYFLILDPAQDLSLDQTLQKGLSDTSKHLNIQTAPERVVDFDTFACSAAAAAAAACLLPPHLQLLASLHPEPRGSWACIQGKQTTYANN